MSTPSERARKQFSPVYDYDRQAWIEHVSGCTFMVLPCGHESKMTHCFACQNVGSTLQSKSADEQILEWAGE